MTNPRDMTEENRMNFQTFCMRMTELLAGILPEGSRVAVRRVGKNNGREITGLMLTEPGSSASPTFGLERLYEAYEAGIPAEEIADQVRRSFEEHRRDFAALPEELADRSLFLEHLRIRLLNYEANRGRLTGTPVKRIMDLAAVPYLELSEPSCNPDMRPVVLVSRNDFARLAVDEEEAFEHAVHNTRKRDPFRATLIYELLEKLGQCGGSHPDIFTRGRNPENYVPMYVLTNDVTYYGAVSLLFEDLLKETSDRLRNNLLLIPSSVHELIAVPEVDFIDARDLHCFAREVNLQCVPPEEVLSDHIYRYDRGTGHLTDLNAKVLRF